MYNKFKLPKQCPYDQDLVNPINTSFSFRSFSVILLAFSLFTLLPLFLSRFRIIYKPKFFWGFIEFIPVFRIDFHGKNAAGWNVIYF